MWTPGINILHQEEEQVTEDPSGKCRGALKDATTSILTLVRGLQPGERITGQKASMQERNSTSLFSLLLKEAHRPQMLGLWLCLRITPGDPRVLLAEHKYLCSLSSDFFPHSSLLQRHS